MAKVRTIVDFMGHPAGDPDAPPFRSGKAAEHVLGVSYTGPWEREADGFNEHTRRCARALAMTGCPVHLRSYGRTVSLGVPRELPRDIAPLLTASVSQYSTQVFQLVLSASMAMNLTTHPYMSEEELKVVNQHKVIYSVWERDRVAPQIADSFNRIGQVWTACWANAEMLKRSGVNPNKIRVIPIPHFADDPLLQLRQRARKPGPPRFYHIGKWEPRKAQDKMLRAFMLAFRPEEAHLVIKTSTLNRPVEGFAQGPVEELVKLLQLPEIKMRGWTPRTWVKSIEIVHKFMKPSEMVALHRFGDAYLSLSRGEGFDMPAYDAKLAGNALVYTPSGGPQDFASMSDFVIDPSGTVPCHSMYGWESDATYLDYDLDEAVRVLRAAHRSIVDGHPRDGYLNDFEAMNVGRRMLSALGEIAEKVY